MQLLEYGSTESEIEKQGNADRGFSVSFFSSRGIVASVNFKSAFQNAHINVIYTLLCV